MKFTVALTGASGAMGGEVLKSLLQSDKDLHIKCLLHSGGNNLPKFVKKLVKKRKGCVEIIKGDVTSAADCKKLIDGADYVIHCASIIPPKADHNPDKTKIINFEGTKNLIEAVKESGGADKVGFVYIATVAMYGNRAYPHIWARVGDPMISSDYDTYSLYKIKAERYLLESGLTKFVSLRQTGILHKYLFKNNLKDGLMFHTTFNGTLEWVTDVDSGIMIKNLIERDVDGKLENFWHGIYNIGGGQACRLTGFDVIDDGFKIMGRGTKAFFKPNWNITRNFHGAWFYDSDELENHLHFRTQTPEDFWKGMAKKYPHYRLGKIVPPALITKLVIKRLFKNTNAPMYWVKHNKEGLVKAYFGGREEYAKIPDNWDDFPLLCKGKLADGTAVDYEKMRNIAYATEHNMLLDHGYDEKKGLLALDFDDLNKAAEFRGGKCLSPDYIAGDIYKKVKWSCKAGHTFTASPFTVLKGGYYCPECEPKPWRYGALADVPFYGQVYFDSHTKDEVNDVYPLFDGETDFLKS